MPPLSPPDLLACAELIVCESDSALQEAIQLMLERARHLMVVSRLDEVDALLQKKSPDLLIVDVDEQTNALAQLARLAAQHPNLKLLLIAGDFSLDFQLAAVRLGITSFQTKPWHTAHFVERVDTLLRGYALYPLQRMVRIKSSNDAIREALQP